MNIELTPNPVELHCEQDQILTVGPIGAEFFSKILGMSIDDVLITDDAELSDFSFSGAHEIAEDPSRTLRQEYRLWDIWVINKVNTVYGLELTTTKISLILLFAMLEASASAHRLLH